MMRLVDSFRQSRPLMNHKTSHWIRRTCLRFAILSALSGFFVFAWLIADPASAQTASPCSSATFDGASYTVCSFDARKDDIRLFWKGPDDKAYGGFSRLATMLAARGRALRFAMNAGMYETDLSPVGLYVEDGRQRHHADLRDGSANFHLKPNGVFYVGDRTAGIAETSRFLAHPPAARYATQSGPMLVIDGRLHPKFRADSGSSKIRNGVCARGPLVWFAISDAPVTFYAFAQLFRDGLGCADALFLDGSVSSLYAPELKRDDERAPLGPIVSVTGP